MRWKKFRSKGLWGNPETSHSRKWLPLLGWRDKRRRWGYPSPGPGMAQRKQEPWQASGESQSQGREAAAARNATPVWREREKHADFPFLLLSTLPPEPPVAQTQLGARWQGAWQPEPRGSGALNTEPAETGRGKELGSPAPRTSTLARQYHLRSLWQNSRKYRYTKRKRLKIMILFLFSFSVWLVHNRPTSLYKVSPLYTHILWNDNHNKFS